MTLTSDTLQSLKYFIRGGKPQELLKESVKEQVGTLNMITEATFEKLAQNEPKVFNVVDDDLLQKKITHLESVQNQLTFATNKEEEELKREKDDLKSLNSQLTALRNELLNTPGPFDEATHVLAEAIVNNLGKPDKLK